MALNVVVNVPIEDRQVLELCNRGATLRILFRYDWHSRFARLVRWNNWSVLGWPRVDSTWLDVRIGDRVWRLDFEARSILDVSAEYGASGDLGAA